MVFPILGYNL